MNYRCPLCSSVFAEPGRCGTCLASRMAIVLREDATATLPRETVSAPAPEISPDALLRARRPSIRRRQRMCIVYAFARATWDDLMRQGYVLVGRGQLVKRGAAA